MTLLFVTIIITFLVIIVSIFFVLWLCLTIILLEVSIHFVDGVVGQMHEHVVKICRPGLFVWLCGKSSEALLVYIYSEWVQSAEQHV